MKKFGKRILSLILSFLILFSVLPISIFAAPASDLPDNMIDSPILRALEYTGYDIQAQKDNGTLYQSGSYSSKTPDNIRSNIHYGTALSGKETVANSSTKTGLAPDIAKFEQYGLCCAGFVTYYVCNYLPNIEGADTQFITDAINATGWNSQAVVTWQKALDNLVSAGQIEKIGTSPSNVNRSKLAPGDLIIFGNDEDSTTHIGVYSGTYNGRDFMIHLGNDMGPEIMPVDWMSNSSNGAKTSDPNGYYHMPEDMIKSEGKIEIYKTSTDGAKLSGARFVATSTTNPNLQYYIGPTDSNGYVCVDGVEYSTYTIKETVFPTNYREYGTSSWNVTLDKNTPNNTVTINAVNEIIPGSCKVIKVSEDNKVDGINFILTGNGVTKTVATSNGGQVIFSDLKPGTYTVTEESIDYYKPVSSQSVTVVSGQTSIVNFSNTLKRGSLKVTKTCRDKNVLGLQFKLTGTSASGEKIEQYAETGVNGVAVFNNVLITGKSKYTITEINVPEQYEPPSPVYVEINWNETTNVTFENKLKSGSITIKKTSEDGKVQGFKFTYKGTSLCGLSYNSSLQTSEKGYCYMSNFPISGDEPYVITEQYNSSSYYEPTEPQEVYIKWKETTEVHFHNKLKRGNLVVRKSSEDGRVEGMTFRLYGTSQSGQTVNEYAVTDADGYARFENILIGDNYSLTEVETPARYVQPETQKVYVKWNNTTTFYVYNTLKKWKAGITKEDSEVWWDHLPQGDATLAGAVYGVYNGDVLIDTYVTDESGVFFTKPYVIGDNNDWNIREISPSEGYLLSDYVCHLGLSPDAFSEEISEIFPIVYENVIKGKVQIIKHSDDGSTQIEHPEKDAVFEVFLKRSGSYDKALETERAIITTDKHGFAETPLLPYGVYTVRQIDGDADKEFVEEFDVNISEHNKSYRYLINNAVHKADVEIVKKDAETGKVILASGIGFKVRNKDTGEYIVQHINYPTPMDIDIYYTDTTGKLMLPYALPYGNYEIIEQNTCYGYVLDTTPVAFKVDGKKDVVTVVKSNYAQKGTITITKNGEVFSSVTENDGIYQPIYEIKGLKGATYEVVAIEDVITLDGTLRYEKGQVVATITTGKDGTATTEPLYLGKYEIRETKAPYGMVINKEPVTVELTYAGELVEITNTSASFTNERQKIVIDLKKNMERDNIFEMGTNGEITNVCFGLFADSDMIAADGKVIHRNALIETAYCDKDGNVVFKTDLPIDASVYVKEINTDCHYILDQQFYNVNFTYAGQETETVHISLNDGETIQNKIKRGTIIGKKVDEDGFEICGALFGLFHANETDFTEDSAILTCESNEIGIFYFTNVPYGNYIVREIKAAPAFVLNETNYEVSIKEDMDIVEIGVENKFITGTVKTIKVDKDYPENTLGGAVFEIYVDVNGNKEFDKDIDILVGEMSEGENGIYTMGNLRYNGYFLHEKTAPEGFLKDDGYYYFEIRESGAVVTVENEAGVGFVNKAITGELHITKTDITDGKPLKNVGFRIKDENGNTVTEGYTDENGVAKFTLCYGKYTYSEFDALDGYYENTEECSFEIKEEGQIIKVDVTNEKKPIPEEPKSPETGDSWLPLLISAIMMFFALIICACVYKRKIIKN